MLNRAIKFFLENKLITTLLLILLIGWGLVTAPFDYNLDFLPRDPVPVDAIPDIGENQQIVFTEWPGQSPQDVEDQITYPLTTALLGLPGVKTIRSNSMFGFSSIYVIFDEDVEFYWSRSRILEKLNSLPSNLLPEGVSPTLGPDATGLGQIFWYTLEGRTPEGEVTGGWDLHELRTVQDFYVRYGLTAVEGVAEVASIGGYVKEYQVDVNPSAMAAADVGLRDIVRAVQESNREVGASTIEINNAEYLVRGLGYIEDLEDLEQAVVAVRENVPIRLQDVAVVTTGPAPRRGVLDKGGAEVVGGVVVARYGSNPLEVINNVKEKIAQIAPGLPKKELEDGTQSQLTIVPFYDRTELIKETLGTLEEALTLEILITIIVIIVMVVNLRASFLISALLPLAVLMTFIGMRYTGVDANIVALSGIAIAIGTMVDLGIILSENMLRHLDEARPGESRLQVIYRATAEVSGAVVTAVSTTVISFLPVFTLQAAEGKLFRPLAFTKTYALIAAVIVALFFIPAFAHWVLGMEAKRRTQIFGSILMGVAGLVLLFWQPWAGVVLLALALVNLFRQFSPALYQQRIRKRDSLPPWQNQLLNPESTFQQRYMLWASVVIVAIAASWLLAAEWLPLGPGAGALLNFLFVVLIIGGVLGFMQLIIAYYPKLLKWCLEYKKVFLAVPSFLLVLALVIWMGFGGVFGWVAKGFDEVGLNVRTTAAWSGLVHTFPGLGEEFMPALDEGSFLLMPTSMPHSGIEENKRVLKMLDMAVSAIPEVDWVVGKLGRVESALDPAPISMYENIISYKSEYMTDEEGHRLRFAVDDEGEFLRDEKGELIEDEDGEFYRQWRDHIRSPDDIWEEIVNATRIPGVTSAPKLQPIETRLIMLQTGMRAPLGIKVSGPDLETIEGFAFKLEAILKEVQGVKVAAVFADRVVGKPYLEIDINRPEIARYGLTIEDVQRHIMTAVGGMPLTTVLEGRERYPVRVRYPRELRDDPESIGNILVQTPIGTQVPLGQLTTIRYVQGPQVIKSENTFLQSYITFDRTQQYSEVEVVENAQAAIDRAVEEGELSVPPGISYEFAGSYENQVRAAKRLTIVVPLVLLVIFLILYLQFRSVPMSLMIFSGIMVALSGGFLMLWLYGQEWFLDFPLFGTSLRELFNMQTVNLSVAVWVGFIALFGIATDDGVLIATYIKQLFQDKTLKTKEEIRALVLEAGSRRVRPALMTTATTIIALLPILTSTGRGADIMIPMAIPAVGGMIVEVITIFVVPTLYSWWRERQLK